MRNYKKEKNEFVLMCRS